MLGNSWNAAGTIIRSIGRLPLMHCGYCAKAISAVQVVYCSDEGRTEVVTSGYLIMAFLHSRFICDLLVMTVLYFLLSLFLFSLSLSLSDSLSRCICSRFPCPPRFLALLAFSLSRSTLSRSTLSRSLSFALSHPRAPFSILLPPFSFIEYYGAQTHSILSLSGSTFFLSCTM